MQKKEAELQNAQGRETNWGENLQDIDQSSLGLDDGTIEQQIIDTFSDTDVRVIKRICYYLASVGLTLDEAYLLVNVDPEKFRRMMKNYPILSKIIEYKELQYKKDLLKTLSAKARGGDDKLSQWLLERKFSQEYGKKAPNAGNRDSDPLDEALNFIRKSQSSSGLVRPESGKLRSPQAPASSGAAIVKKIRDILK